MLDLHGVKHEEVEVLVEDFFLSREPPFEVIVGNSSMMLSKVVKVADKLGYLCFYKHENNLGSLIIVDKI